MEVFPENLELVEFFDAEPTVSDVDVPWIYNRLMFSTRLDDERIDCLIDNPQLEVRWYRHEVELAYLTFHAIQKLSVQDYPGGKSLVALGVGPNRNLTFRLQIRPRVHLVVEVSQ